MDTQDLDKAIKKASKLCQSIIQGDSSEFNFNQLIELIDKIIIAIEESSQNEIQLKTVEIISQLEIEQFKLNRFQRLTYPFSKTGTFWLPNNSSDQLRIRYALEVRSRLSILDEGKD